MNILNACVRHMGGIVEIAAIEKDGLEKLPGGDELKIGIPELPPLRQQDKLSLPNQHS